MMEVEGVFIHLGREFEDKFIPHTKPSITAEVFVEGIGQLKLSLGLSTELLEALKKEVLIVTRQKMGMKEV